MKKAILILTLALTFFSGFGQSFSSPFRIDEQGIILARKLANKLNNTDKKFLLSGNVTTDVAGVYQKFFVFCCNGKRFSIYYQWQAGDPSLINDEFLSVYVRKEGSDDPDDLQGYKDYHLNGSWDEHRVGIYHYWAETEESTYFDNEIQTEYLVVLKEALSYFN
jgi:hypothetical protein